MIEPIKKDNKEYLDWQDNYGVTKFLAKDGEGHRGVIVGFSDDKKQATIYGLTGEFSGKVINVKETNPAEWPIIE